DQGRHRLGEHLPRHQLHDALRRHGARGHWAGKRFERHRGRSGTEKHLDFIRRFPGQQRVRDSLTVRRQESPAPALQGGTARSSRRRASKRKGAHGPPSAPTVGYSGLFTSCFNGLLPAVDHYLVFVGSAQRVSFEHFDVAQVGKVGQLGNIDIAAGWAAEGLNQFGFLDFTREQDVVQLLCVFRAILRVLDDGHGLGCHKHAFSRVDQLDFLLATGHISVSSVFHGHANGVFAVGHALVHLTGALGNDSIRSQLVQPFLAIDLVDAVNLVIGTARCGGVANDDLVLPLRVEQILPALGRIFALELLVIDHDHHNVGVGAGPEVIGTQEAFVQALGFSRVISLEVVLECSHGAETGTPHDVAQRVGGFSLNALHQSAGAGSHTLYGEVTRLVLGDVQGNVDHLHVVGGIYDRFSSKTAGAESHCHSGQYGGSTGLQGKSLAHVSGLVNVELATGEKIKFEKAHREIHGHNNHEHQDDAIGRSSRQIPGVDLPEHLNGHGFHATVIQHDGGGNFRQRCHPHENGRAKNGRLHHWQHHFEETLHGRYAKIDGCFFDGIGNAVERCRGGTNGERHFPHEIGGSHDDPGTRQDDVAAVVRMDQRNTQYSAGNGQRQHHHVVEHAHHPHALLHNEVTGHSCEACAGDGRHAGQHQ